MPSQAASTVTGPTDHSQGRRLRPRQQSVGAVLAGVLVIVVLSIATDGALHASGVYPPLGRPMADGLFVLATAYRVAYGVLGGYLTARLAPRRPMAHAIVLGVVGLAVGIAGAAATWSRGPEFGPHWYPISIAAIALPCSWAGGRLRRGRGAANGS